MKADIKYTSIDECPTTGTQMSHSDIYSNYGVCPYCGDVESTVSHHNRVTGRFIRPSCFERIFLGKRNEFLRKDEEDKIMETLKREV